jgi:hypothetical protein
MRARQQIFGLQRLMDRGQRLGIQQRGIGRLDMRDEMGRVVLIGFRDVDCIAGPARAAFVARKGIDVVGRDDQLCPRAVALSHRASPPFYSHPAHSIARPRPDERLHRTQLAQGG